MGSEHYCLRWNNHQSNLLGVFSQLLQDESLVDVTLACSEGASIRAHKVVLSACSSYFQSLFLDHPEKHPIVILKDVRLSELQTLVEFMYKGEVNVQYCQLSALLKTAESLKVKGLAEMTNQSTALREPEREPDRLRPHSQPSKLSPSTCDHHQTLTTMETSTISGSQSSGLLNPQQSTSTTNLLGLSSSLSSASGTALQLTTSTSINNLNASVKRENDRNSPSPPKRLHTSTSSSPLPLDLYQRRCPSSGGGIGGNRTERNRGGIDRDDHDSPISSRRTPINNDEQFSPSCIGGGGGGDKERNRSDRQQHLHHQQQQQQHHNNSTDDEDNGSNDVGINMTINPNSSLSGNGIGLSSTTNVQSIGHQSSSQSVVVPPPPSAPPINSSNTSITDLTRPSSRTSGIGGGGGNSNCGIGNISSITHTATSSRISSPIISTAGGSNTGNEPVAGPSGLGPVQSVPLSLKKEIDWDRNDDKSTGDTLDYRHSHDSTTDDHVIPNFPRSMSAHPATGRCQTPFAFPFTPLGLSLFDTDPSRILTMLHHQTLLAEEALRYRGLLFSSPKDPLRFSSISDILSSSKDQENKRSIMYKTQNNNNNNNNSTMNNNNTITSRFMTAATTTFNNHHHHHQQQQHHHHHQQQQQQLRQTASASPQYYKDSILEELKKRSEETVQREEEAEMELALNGTSSGILAGSSNKDTYNTFFRRNVGGGSCSSLIETASLRYTASTETSSSKEKSSSSSTSSTPPPPPLNKSTTIMSNVDSLLFTEPIEEETRCVVCNAQFPNVWLLEQHAALQHPSNGPDDKPFICEQCGQSYRYRSAYAKHKEQNHRARLPADKLFTCDVCGMQFRYLKSFKKHRLNHALERLHGKKDRRNLITDNQHGGNQDIVTSTNETINNNEVTDLRINIKREQNDGEEEQDNTVDSAGAQFVDNNASITNGEPKITSSEGIYSTNKRPRIISLLPEPESSQLHPVATTSINSINSLINAERIPSDQLLGLNPQEASILNFLRVDAAERQRDKRTPSSRFACPFCGKCVRSKENLKLHVRKHTGERPFVCLFCGRAFGGKSDLTRHLRIHTGERPYHCESCGKCFARADYLSKHLTTHIHNAPR